MADVSIEVGPPADAVSVDVGAGVVSEDGALVEVCSP